MIQAADRSILRMAVFTVSAFVIGFVAVSIAHGDDHKLDPSKFYLTATITDEKGNIYTKLAYRTSGPWDTKEACEHWVPDDAFKSQLPILVAKAAEAFGPGADIHFACEQPPVPGKPGEHI